jgi:nucleotide-binding universal stress UspA family protein
MFETVIVPLDGSRHAEVALPLAIDEARRHGAVIVLLHVIPRPEPCQSTVRRSGPSPWQGAWPAREIGEAKRTALNYLDDVIRRYQLGPATARRVVVGLPGNRIALEAIRYPRPLVVLTTGDPSRAPLDRSHVAEYVFAAGGVPVLGVRDPGGAVRRDGAVQNEAPRPLTAIVANGSVESVPSP